MEIVEIPDQLMVNSHEIRPVLPATLGRQWPLAVYSSIVRIVPIMELHEQQHHH